jgi:hypothetical protein
LDDSSSTANKTKNSNFNNLNNIKTQELLSPKFNEEPCDKSIKKDQITITKESKKYDNSSQKFSDFTFNGKDSSMSNTNTFIIDSDSSRVGIA